VLPVGDEGRGDGLRQGRGADPCTVQPRLHLHQREARRPVAQGRHQGKASGLEGPQDPNPPRLLRTLSGETVEWSVDRAPHGRVLLSMPSLPDRFPLVSDFQVAGDQVRAVPELIEGLRRGDKSQVLLGVTGSGKTFTMAQVVATVNRPTLVMAHNKTLAA